MSAKDSFSATQPPASRRLTGAVLLFLLALWLRTSGLSHDLHLGNVYHADAPKQMRAVERFLNDRFGRQYYRVWGNRDMDGYPYFNSHLVEHIFRGYAALRNAALWQVGVPADPFTPGILSIYWAARLLNSFLSALAVVLVYSMGRRHFGPAAGLAGGLLLAFSPVDITTSNFAMSDSTSAFFALLAVYFALRIVESPRIGFYLLGALAAALAFSAKYHGGMALIPLGAAHLLAFPRPRSWVSRKALFRVLLLPVFFVLGVFLSTPSLMVYPSGAYKDIRDFMEWTAGFGMSPELRQLPLSSRFILAMRLNLPLLADYLGAIPAAAAAAGIWLFRGNRKFWVLLSLPLFFLLVGLTSKPLSHPDYFTVAIPPLLLAGGAVFGRAWRAERGRVPFRLLGVAGLGASLLYLGNYAGNEIFFFRRNDTRRVAESWARDNLPRNFRLHTGAYTFDGSPWRETDDPEGDRVIVLSGRDPGDPPNTEEIHRVSFERDKLSRMRNWDIRFLLAESRFLRPGFSVPVLERIPASRRDDIIQADAPVLQRSGLVWELAHRDRVRAVVVSKKPLAECAVILRNAQFPAEVTVRFGGKRQRVTLEPHENKVLRWKAPGAIPLTRNANHFYGISVRSRFNLSPVRVVLAGSPLEIARESYLAGNYEKAFDFFSRVEAEKMNYSELLAMAAAGLAGGELPEAEVYPILGWGETGEPERVPDPDSTLLDEHWFFREFGFHPRIFNWLDGGEPAADPLEAVREQLRVLGALISEDPASHQLSAPAWPLLLERGRALARAGNPERAFAFYRTALALETDSRGIYQALEGLIPFLPDSEEEIRQLTEPYRAMKEKPGFPREIRFANGVGIKGVTVNTLNPARGENLELYLDWDIPKLDPGLYGLEYRIQFINLEDPSIRHVETHHFVRAAMTRSSFDSLRPRSYFGVYLDEIYPPGSYSVELTLLVPAHDRSLRVVRPKDARGKSAEIVRVDLTGG